MTTLEVAKLPTSSEPQLFVGRKAEMKRLEECLREAFNGNDLPLGDIANSRDAGSAGLAIDQDGTGSALAFATSVLAAGQIEMVAQDKE